ncbi:MAG: alpha/beta hydrolase [Oscillospiraceae bacterium]|nr:alpha/beta hydrolase [Oscillospiraceae bacterium]
MSGAVVYVHGRGGSPDESARYAPLFPGCAVLGLNYRGDTPWEAGPEIREAIVKLRERHDPIDLIANSIGAYFSMHAGLNGMIRRAYFISPVVDMEALIRGSMARAGVTEALLRERGAVRTDSGEMLSWAYLRFVIEHPLDWRVPTQILYGSRDELTARDVIGAFAQGHGAGLTVMEGGEHWFHTQEQLRFLDAWLRRCAADA